MALPIVAIVGRPNVGKSSLVNRIIQSDEAIVDPIVGVTRDRSYHEADWNGVSFMLIDTGGIEVASDDRFQASISAQALEAVNEADVIIFVVDGQSGVLDEDAKVAKILRTASKPVLLVVNKLDTPNRLDEIWEFYSLGLGDPWPLSALHGHGSGDLLDAVVAALPPASDEPEEEAVSVALIGRPNAGKSSLMNALVGEDRSIVSDVAGTTRDAVDSMVIVDDRRYRLVDTAGLRKKSAMDGSLEYYGFVRAMRAIDRADVTLLVIDGSLGLTNEDQRVAGYAAERGRALALLINKSDLIPDAQTMEALKERIHDRMTFVGYAPVHVTSAVTGRGVKGIWPLIDAVYESYTSYVPTGELNRFLSRLKETGQTRSVGRAHLRLKYVTQVDTAPPQFVFFANRPDLVDENYRRYLEHSLRAAFPLEGTPVRLRFKKGD